jgi:hypothetical protein
MKPMKYIRLYEKFNIGLFAIIDSNKKNKNIEIFLKTHPGEIVGEDFNTIRIRYTWHNDFNIDVPYKWKWSFFEINKQFRHDKKIKKI